ncbi:MAG: 2'-5' RNA ligase family protein [Oscillospiraceae bacterium]
MKATFVLLADDQMENAAAKLAYQADLAGDMGFLARSPFHLSLKQPFDIADLPAVERFFDEYAASIAPVTAHFIDMILWENNIFGEPSGVLVLKAEKTSELAALHEGLNSQLQMRFGDCPAAFDGEAYQFHLTFAIGGAPFSAYQKVYAELKAAGFPKQATFDRLGLLYYSGDEIRPGSYFCYKRARLGK